MLISTIYNKLTNSQKEDFVVGLVGGLVWGLVGGLVWGLVWGLVVGLVGGLVWGLVVILVNFTEAYPFIQGFMPILLIIIGILLIAEIMFWLTKEKKLKKNLFWHTCKRKIENIFEVLLGVSAISQIYILTRDIDFSEYFPTILKWIGYIGAGIIIIGIVVGLFYLWIKLNELKYKR